jgi:protein transport protein SEC24
VRTSSGLRVSRYLGNFSERAEGEADVGVLDTETGLIALLSHDGNEVKEGEELYVQAAALFTTAAGQRRVRVHNLRIVATDSIQAVFRHADLDTVLGVLLRNGGSVRAHFFPPAAP